MYLHNCRMADPGDGVFKALADPTRRELLDRLRQRDGQTLTELCEGLGMARQSVTQHLALLEAANLVGVVRRGRERIHYLNPVPLHQMQERWIDKFAGPGLRALSAIKRQAEEKHMSNRPTFFYVTYIKASPDEVWATLTDADLTGQFWGHRNVSTWDPGARWEHQRTDASGVADVVGTVLEAEKPHRLVMTFETPNEAPMEDPSRVIFTIEPYQDIVRMSVLHENLPSDEDLEAASAGWPAVLANLKSLLETGAVLPQAPWEMYAELREKAMAPNNPS